MSKFSRSVWLYPLFQIPLILFAICLVGSILCGVLTLGRPTVAVAIALDFSNSSYQSEELTAVQSYIDQNFQQLKTPNQIQIFGFGDQVVPLTSSFNADKQKIETELSQALANPNLKAEIGTGANLDQALDQGIKALSNVSDRCRELLLVTPSTTQVSPSTTIQAAAQKVKINAISLGESAPNIQIATGITGGTYQYGGANNLQVFFKEVFFPQFNSNIKWVIFWRGCTWMAFMWLITLPLDKWVFQELMHLPMNLSGLLALGNALFWTIVTPLIIWRLFGLPFLSAC